MKLGSKLQLEQFKHLYKDNPAKLEETLSKVKWARDDIWYIEEPTDGERERKQLEKIMSAKVVIGQNVGQDKILGLPPLPPQIAENKLRKHTAPPPPIKPIPPFTHRALQYLKTVTGPKVSLPVFESRMKKCKEEGGCAYASKTGVVTEVSSQYIYIDGAPMPYPADEVPIVAIGDRVTIGQTVTKSHNKKPCPMLNVKTDHTGTTKYYCGGCGCGERKKAELSEKLHYARVVCPRTPPQFLAEDENGPNILKE